MTKYFDRYDLIGGAVVMAGVWGVMNHQGWWSLGFFFTAIMLAGTPRSSTNAQKR